MSIYLDSAATTRPGEACIAAMTEAMRISWGNPSSLHRVGLEAQLRMECARGQLAAALGCEPSALIFTSGATESNHLAVRGAAGAYGKRKKKVITTTVEHASVRGAFDMLEEQGFEVVRIAPDADGILRAEDIAAAADENTCLVSMMLVNNETGAVLPVQQTFAMIAREYPHIIKHCDAVQGFLKLPVSPEKLHADLLTVSGHKVHACKGVGALYRKKRIRLFPLMKGGEQEGSIRPGTESVPLIAGFGAAAAELSETVTARAEYVGNLRSELIAGLEKAGGISVNSPSDGSPYILSFAVRGLRSETVLHFLSEKGISVSSGSACSKGKQSGVLEQFGVKPDLADSTIRVSFCAENTPEDVTALCEALKEAQERLVHKR
ncbi:MAG: cysteine desulfurase [Oscillospiraceae bacterium]|nr:cysteine desulfurase [Oscillospiraceae bacterium]